MINNRYIIYQLTEFFGGFGISAIGLIVFMSSFRMGGTEAEIIAVQMICGLMIYIGALKWTPYIDETIIWGYNAISQIIYRWITNRKKDKK